MAGHMMAVVLVLVAATWTVGVKGSLLGVQHGNRCLQSTYRSDAPAGNDSTVWLYVFQQEPYIYHSGIGAQGAFWFYTPRGVHTLQNYTQNLCDGPLRHWYNLGETDKTKEEIQAVVNNLTSTCYPGYNACWKFIGNHFSLRYWNCNHFSGNLALALGFLDFPCWVRNSAWPSFC